MRREYNNGYQGKIEYWSGKLIEGVKANDYKVIFESKKRLDYFVDRQKELIYKNSLVE
jgi:hypothetical protein